MYRSNEEERGVKVNKEEYRCGLWQKKSEKGTIYYQGKLKLGATEYQLTLFKNNKTNEKQPDLNILVRNNTNSQGNEKQSNKGQKNSELGQDNTQVYADFGNLTEIDENMLAF